MDNLVIVIWQLTPWKKPEHDKMKAVNKSERQMILQYLSPHIIFISIQRCLHHCVVIIWGSSDVSIDDCWHTETCRLLLYWAMVFVWDILAWYTNSWQWILLIYAKSWKKFTCYKIKITDHILHLQKSMTLLISSVCSTFGYRKPWFWGLHV